MKRLRTYKNKNKNTINKLLFFVFFCVFMCSFLLFNSYSSIVTPKAFVLIDQKLDKIMFQFFSDLITNDVINRDSVNDILEITKNSKGEILTVNYDLEKTYKILTDVSQILENGINNLENGKIDVTIYDKYLNSSQNGLILNIPLFLGSENIFLNNLGPNIPVLINFNEFLLTNIKTKVTNYGFNNALLEIYITVEMQKLIITPLKKNEDKFYYDILIGAMVVNGSVPEFYGGTYENSSKIFDIPMS
ncbi:MAG: hypothetical protein E7161_01545 [Firmicutes bacterium]|nr:hypothetical protein [Bacillota bacterium]